MGTRAHLPRSQSSRLTMYPGSCPARSGAAAKSGHHVKQAVGEALERDDVGHAVPGAVAVLVLGGRVGAVA